MSVHVDIHCHSSSKAFMSGMSHPSKNLYRRFPFTIEHPIYRLLRKPIAKFSNIRLETQSAFDQLFEGGVRVAFVSVTPMEKAFTMLNPLAKGTKNELLKSFLKEPSNYRDGFIGSKAMNALTGFKVSDIDSIKGSVYHIYQELFLPEIDFLLSEKDKKSPDGRYTVRFPKNYSELKQYLLDPSNLNILLTVEGAHCFGEASTLPVLQAGITNTHSTDTHNVAYANQMAANIRDFRTRYPVPLFSVGLCHHFWNGLAGHARSLASLLEAVLNQDEGLNGPLLDAGRMVIDELSRKEYDQKKVRPVLIDIKHMSPLCRKDYYAYRRQKPELQKLPVFCSHTGINMSFETLDEWIQYVRKNPSEKAGKKYDDGRYYLHEQSINLCREDLVEVWRSRGLIGIQLDEKRIMGPLAFEELKKRSSAAGNNEQRYVYAKVIWANIFCAIDELQQSGLKMPWSPWELFSIGSDFDGLINHLDAFGSASDMHSLKAAMTYFLIEPEPITLFDQDARRRYTLEVADLERLKEKRSPQELVERLFGTNALEFLERNFS